MAGSGPGGRYDIGQNASDLGAIKGALGVYVADRPNTIITFGDSITADGHRASTTFIGFTMLSWFEWANARAQNCMTLVRNAGVAGDTLTQMAARIQADVIDYHPQYCLMMGGQNNDLSSAALADAAYDLLVGMYDQLVTAGIYVIACSVLPDSTGTTDNKKGKQRLNARLKNYWRGRSGGEYVDLYAALVDPLQASANPITLTTRDGVHPNCVGAYMIGKALAPVFQRINGSKAYPLLSAQIDRREDNAFSRNVNRNGLMLSTGGTGTKDASFTGSVADRWAATKTGTPSCALSLVTRSDGYGYNQKLSISSAAASDQVLFSCTSLGVSTFTAGETYFADAEVTITNPVGLACLEMSLSFVGGAGCDTRTFTFASGNANGQLSESVGPIIYRTKNLLLPAATYTGATISFIANFGAAGSSVDIEIGRVGVWQL